MSRLSADDRDSVKSNIQHLGSHGALRWAMKELADLELPHPNKRRMLVLTIREAASLLELDVSRAKRLARCHAVGLRSIGVKV